MGTFYDLFIATQSEVSEYVSQNFADGVLDSEDFVDPIEAFESISIKSLTDLDIYVLFNLLGESDPYSITNEELVFTVSEEEGPWLSRHPDKFVSLLSALADNPQRIHDVANSWAATEDMAAYGWTTEEAQEALTSIARLAKRAAIEGKNIYQWSVV